MAKLACANGSPGAEADLTAPAMSCHRDQPDTAHPMRLCAGWLAVVGRHHLSIRMAVIAGHLPAGALVAGEGWPSLHASLDELLAARTRSLSLTATAGRPAGVLGAEVEQQVGGGRAREIEQGMRSEDVGGEAATTISAQPRTPAESPPRGGR